MTAEEYERYLANSRYALEALALVVEDRHVGNYEPHRSALAEALDWLEMEVTCGDCIEGRCHWGGEESRMAMLAAAEGGDYRDEFGAACGCDRHGISVETRRSHRRTRVNGVSPATVTRRLAKGVIRMAHAGGMPDTYWATDRSVVLACEVLGWTTERALAADGEDLT